MRVLTPKGKILKIGKAEQVVEARVHFNGDDIRLCQVAKDKAQSVNGVYLTKSIDGFGMASENIFIGNLKSEKVKEIMNELLTQGYVDLSALQYQPPATGEKLFDFDDGQTLPYYVDEPMYIMKYSPNSLHSPFSDPFTFGQGISGINDSDNNEEEFCDEDEEIV